MDSGRHPVGQANDGDGCLLDRARIDDLERRALLSSIDHQTDQPTIVLGALGSTGTNMNSPAIRPGPKMCA